jgi:hypothetical protein
MGNRLQVTIFNAFWHNRDEWIKTDERLMQGSGAVCGGTQKHGKQPAWIGPFAVQMAAIMEHCEDAAGHVANKHEAMFQMFLCTRDSIRGQIALARRIAGRLQKNSTSLTSNDIRTDMLVGAANRVVVVQTATGTTAGTWNHTMQKLNATLAFIEDWTKFVDAWPHHEAGHLVTRFEEQEARSKSPEITLPLAGCRIGVDPVWASTQEERDALIEMFTSDKIASCLLDHYVVDARTLTVAEERVNLCNAVIRRSTAATWM